MKDAFFSLCDSLRRDLRAGETLLCTLHGERSDFVRFNHGKVRQAGSVESCHLTLRLVARRRQASIGLPLFGSGDLEEASAALHEVRDGLSELPEDPWLLVNEAPESTESMHRGVLPDAQALVRDTVEAVANLDFVGIYAGGTIFRGFANSLGQKNWHEVDSFNFDWSVYRHADQAVKAGYAGFEWDADLFRRKVAAAADELRLLEAPRRQLRPGEYRAYLAPRAMEDIAGLLCWGGFSARSRETKQSPLLRMQSGQSLSPIISFLESTAESAAPGFQSDGFVKPPRVVLIEHGVLKEPLVSPRSAREYGLPANAANSAESPEALELAPGTLEPGRVLPELDTGLYVSNLWYLNFSDRPAGRMTGMTRFATFWVEGGRIAAPVAPMRFDDSIYRMLGESLIDLARERELLPDTSTYEGRSTSSMRLPGALLASMRFTL